MRFFLDTGFHRDGELLSGCDLTYCVQRIGVIALIRFCAADLRQQFAVQRILIILLQREDADLIRQVGITCINRCSGDILILFSGVDIGIGISSVLKRLNTVRKTAALIDTVIVIDRLYIILNKARNRRFVVGKVKKSLPPWKRLCLPSCFCRSKRRLRAALR